MLYLSSVSVAPMCFWPNVFLAISLHIKITITIRCYKTRNLPVSGALLVSVFTAVLPGHLQWRAVEEQETGQCEGVCCQAVYYHYRPLPGMQFTVLDLKTPLYY